jgi:IMP dehydrogenase
MDGVLSPATAIELGNLGGLGCLNLEGLWTRYDNPDILFEEIADLPMEKATRRMQEIYSEPIKEELIGRRIREIKDAGVTACASLTPQRVEQYSKFVLEAELDILVIQGTVVSAEHVSKTVEPLNLKKFIREFDVPIIVGGCASYSTALHLMRTAACSASACRRPPPSPTPPARASVTSTRPACTCTSSPTAGCARAATSPRRSRAAPTR